MNFKVGDKVYYPHPIVDKQSNKTIRHERRIGTIRSIYGELCEIGSEGDTILNVQLSSLELVPVNEYS